jgi:adenylate cyclase
VRVYRVEVGEALMASPSAPALSLPDKPSIAVLPFQNISGDPEQEYFADGMVEDIITALSRIVNAAGAWHVSSFVRTWLGQPDLAVDHEMRAMRLSPLDPRIGVMEFAAAIAHFCAGHIGEAVTWVRKGTRDLPNWPVGLATAAAIYALGGQVEEARDAVARLRQVNPTAHLADIMSLFPLRRSADMARVTEGLIKAGMPH